MNMYRKNLVVILAESALEQLLAQDIKALGAHGYTVTDARGNGSHGYREASWDADGSIRMEIICEEAVAEKIAEAVFEKYFKNYAVCLYLSEVKVLRTDKY